MPKHKRNSPKKAHSQKKSQKKMSSESGEEEDVMPRN
jgi:hypothetical protein